MPGMRIYLRIVFGVSLGLAFALPSFALELNLTWGIKAGFPVVSGIQTDEPPPIIGSLSLSKNLKPSIGITVEAALPRGFAVEIDGLYQPLKYRQDIEAVTIPPLSALINGAQITSEQTSWVVRGHAWEFPLVVKKYVAGPGRFRVYGGAGVTLRRAVGVTDFTDVHSSRGLLAASSERSAKARGGFLVNGGVDLTFHSVHILPEARFAQWWKKTEIEFRRDALFFSRNRLELLVGIAFHH